MRNKKTAIECCWPPKSSIWGKAAYNEDFLTRNLLVKIAINDRHLMFFIIPVSTLSKFRQLDLYSDLLASAL